MSGIIQNLIFAFPTLVACGNKTQLTLLHYSWSLFCIKTKGTPRRRKRQRTKLKNNAPKGEIECCDYFFPQRERRGQQANPIQLRCAFFREEAGKPQVIACGYSNLYPSDTLQLSVFGESPDFGRIIPRVLFIYGIMGGTHRKPGRIK